MNALSALIAAHRINPASALFDPKFAARVEAIAHPKAKRLSVPAVATQNASKPDPAAEADYQRRQAATNARVIREAEQMGRERARQVAAATVPASTRTAAGILAAAARARGEKFDPAKVIAGAPQRRVVATADAIILAGKRRRGEA
jgi:hypothetical protein